MAKPVIKFTAAPYEVNGYKGYRIQLEKQGGKFDLDFCKEVVEAKRLAMSADELLHAIEMLAEVAAAKVAEDGRPRGITKLIKWNRYAKGKLESPSSPWNETCKAIIRPQLLADVSKVIDATFQNTTEGIGVRINDVTYDGAKTVQNVIKPQGTFSANGSHMEFLEGDSAMLSLGETEIQLECVESDVSHARFNAPEALEDIEPGSVMQFVMKSRGGVEDGQVYTSKKAVTLLAGLAIPKLVSFTQLNAAGNVESEGLLTNLYSKIEIKAKHIPEGVKGRYAVYSKSTGALLADTKWDPNPLDTTFERVSDTFIRAEFKRNSTVEPDGAWYEVGNPVKFELLLPNGTIIALDIPYDVH